jgi:hypothetical protein
MHGCFRSQVTRHSTEMGGRGHLHSLHMEAHSGLTAQGLAGLAGLAALGGSCPWLQHHCFHAVTALGLPSGPAGSRPGGTRVGEKGPGGPVVLVTAGL